MASSYILKMSTAKTLEACKFRERVPALEGKAPSRSAVIVERAPGRRAVDETFVVTADDRRFEGSREAVGSSAASNSCYVTVTVNEQDGTMTLAPLGDWYAFRPEVTHETIGLDDAEMLMTRSDRRSVLADKKLEKLLNPKNEGDKLEEEEGGATAGQWRGGAAGGGSSVSGAPRDSVRRAGGPQATANGDSDGEFDDGAEPNWAARADHDEDGNEGLDMADEDLFEDDEDDSFEATKARERQYGWVSTDQQEDAAHEAMEDARSAFEERRIKQLAEIAQGHEEAGGAAAADDDEELELHAGESAWGKLTKEGLKEDRARRRRDADSDEEDDDYDETEDIADAMRRESELAANEAEAAQAARAAVKAEAGSSGAGAKRALSPGGASGGLADTAAAKRAKQEQLQRTAAAAANMGAASLVEEKDIVMLIHKHGQMPLKDLIARFKEHTAKSKEAKQEFVTLMSKVACTEEVEKETEGGSTVKVKMVRLKDSTLVEYDLDDPLAR